MSKRSTQDLTDLVLSLSKSEKRSFKLYLKRSNSAESMKYIQLFNSIVKKGAYDETFVLESTDVAKRQLSNLKSVLYRQILSSLQRDQNPLNPEKRIRNMIEQADILFDRGLYNQSQGMLNKALELAREYHFDQIKYEILHREKITELQHTIGVTLPKAAELRSEAEKAARGQELTATFSGITLQLHSYYIQRGHVSNQDQFEELQEFYQTQIPEFQPKTLSPLVKIHYYRANSWYHFVMQNFRLSYRSLVQAIQVIEEHDLIPLRPIVYLKLINGMLNCLLHMSKPQRFSKALIRFDELGRNDVFLSNKGVPELLTRYKIIHEINEHFLHGTFREGAAKIKNWEDRIASLRFKSEPRYDISLQYKIACLYFGFGDYDNCLLKLNRIIFLEDITFRQDIHRFARILKLACLFEMKQFDELFANIAQAYQYLRRNKDMNRFQKEILNFLRRITRIDPADTVIEFKRFRETMQDIAQDPFEQRPFFYFDIISWLDSNILDIPVDEIIRTQGLGHNKRLAG